MNLFNISTEYLQLMQELENNEGEITPELVTKLTINETDFEKKATAYRHTIIGWRSKIALIKEEIKRLKSLEGSLNNSIETLTTNIDVALKSRDINKLDLGINGGFSYRKSTIVEVDETRLPEQWYRITKSVNKEELSKYMKEGNIVEGAELISRSNLQIK